MNYEDHVAAARTFLSAAEILSERGMGMAAAEMVWGAAVQAIDAASHSMATRHAGNNRDRLQVLQRLGQARGIEEELYDGFGIAVSKLHNHFYTGRLSAEELEESMRIGVSFVALTLELADLTE